MPHQQLVYLCTGCGFLVIALLTLALARKKKYDNHCCPLATLLWVSLKYGLCFLWVEESRKTAIEYLSAYLMEWSLSIDNVFVFVLIFSAFQIKAYHPRVFYWQVF